jgi:dipeptidyl aminopeptidase/acylaminoacyl peptidase
MTDASRNQGSWKTIDLNDHIYQISAGRHLAYTQVIANSTIWRARIPAAGDPPAAPERFLHSTRTDSGPKYSPDGQKISFFSTRSGTPEFWIAKRDGSNPTRVTSFGGPSVNYPAWSPDGQWLVFHARLEGQADLFVMPAAGGAPKRLTTHPADEIDPVFSKDGSWIYCSSFRSGRWQIWKVRATGGEESQISSRGGLKPIESPDGKTIYFISETKRAIWQVPSAGGPESEVLAKIHPTMLGFQVTRQGIYYVAPPHSGNDCYLRFRSFSTGRDRAVVLVRDSPFGTVISVDPEEKYLLLHQTDRPGMDLMLVDNFQMPR